MLKARVFLFFAVLLLLLNFTGCSNEKYVRFDGYYSNQEQYYDVPTFFRFYDDGTVTASLPDIVEHVIQFKPAQLDRNNVKECTIRGRYTLKGNKVSFRLTDSNGSADFSGEFLKNAVKLKSHSNINGKDTVTIYNFYK